jgi:hypothetical protein
VDAVGEEELTPLSLASAYGHVEVVRALLARGAAVDAADSDGATPLVIASEHGHFEVARELLARGASPRAAASNGDTALTRATANGHHAVAKRGQIGPPADMSQRKQTSCGAVSAVERCDLFKPERLDPADEVIY